MQKLIIFLFIQVWKAASSSSLSAFCEFWADRAAVLPQDHWKHSHGETVVWHVQKLKTITHTPVESSTIFMCGAMIFNRYLLCIPVYISENLRAVIFLKATLSLFVGSTSGHSTIKFSSYHHACCLFVSYLDFDLCQKRLLITFHHLVYHYFCLFCDIYNADLYYLVIDGLYIPAVINVTVIFMFSCLDKVKNNAWKWFSIQFL